MDLAYKSLEGTEKFCDQHNKKFSLFNSSSSSLNASVGDKLTEHEKLFRRTVIADCLLFEAVLVFLKQGLTSYVKGGYLMRKAWKMYEKIFQEAEKLCSTPSPITKAGVASPIDKHIGRSLYDQYHGKEEDEDTREEEEVCPDEDGVADVSDSLDAMHLGLSMLSGGPVKLEFGDEEEEEEGEEFKQVNQGDAPVMITVGEADHPLAAGSRSEAEQAPPRSVSAAVMSSSKPTFGIGSQQKSHSQSDLLSKVQQLYDVCVCVCMCVCVCVCVDL